MLLGLSVTSFISDVVHFCWYVDDDHLAAVFGPRLNVARRQQEVGDSADSVDTGGQKEHDLP